jgi:hypothetical protein
MVDVIGTERVRVARLGRFELPASGSGDQSTEAARNLAAVGPTFKVGSGHMQLR